MLDLGVDHLGAEFIEWLPRVPDSEREAFEARIRAEGLPNFRIVDQDLAGARDSNQPQTQHPSPRRSEYFPVLYIEPSLGCESILGLDLSSHSFWPRLVTGLASGELIASGRLPIAISDHGWEWGYILVAPVYDQPADQLTEVQRPQHLLGWIHGVFRLKELVESLLQPGDPAEVDILFTDKSAPVMRQFLSYYSAATPNGGEDNEPPTVEEMSAGIHSTATFNVAGRQWQLIYRPSSRWAGSSSGAPSWLVLALGLAASAGLATCLGMAQRHTTRLKEIAQLQEISFNAANKAREIDAQLRESEHRLQSIIDQNPFPIFAKDLEGCYFLANRPFEQLIRCERDMILGRADPEIFPAGQAQQYREHDLRVIATGSGFTFVEASPAPGKREIMLAIHKFPLRDPSGRIYAIGGIGMNIAGRAEIEPPVPTRNA